jgi:hypothetical protein
VVFELLSNITQLPQTSRQERMARKHEIINSKRTHREQRIRLWLMRFSVLQLSITFLGAFVAMCVAYAGMFQVLVGGCCGASEMRFSDTFAFSVQTAATIGTSCLVSMVISSMVSSSGAQTHIACRDLLARNTNKRGLTFGFSQVMECSVPKAW